MSEKRKLAINSISMLVNRLTQGVVTFALTAVIARSLGASALGQYLLAVGYYYIFVNLTSQGLKTLFTRELAREPKITSVCLVSGSLLQFILSIIGYIALVITVFILPYNADTSLICYITGLTIIPFALSNITEAIFQAQEKMHLIAFSTVPIYVLRLFLMIWVMQLNYGIEYISGILVISETLILVIEWLLLIKNVKPQWKIDKDFIWDTLYQSRTFFAIEGLGIISLKIDLIIISLLESEELIGIYGAISQLFQPFSIIANSIALAGFPGMSKAANIGKEKQREVTQNIIRIMLCMGLPFMLGLLFFSKELLLFVYNNEKFAEASMILNLKSVGLITSSFTQVSSYLLLASGFEKFNLISSLFSSMVGGFAGIVLISQYQLIGAAFMSLLMTFSHLGIMTYAVYTKLFSFQLWGIIRIPLLLSVIMSAVFWIMKIINLYFLFTLIVAILAYLSIISLMIIKKFGGFKLAWKKLLNK
ncbi:oligosaccharide flippase family protein [Nodularia sphaerocarpa]|uniref:oligosaccharide flippase family protein n=1 Tax=Nodularia sphaerocarpa TaxID=137816 RepID=UPI001EFBD844|nr:oligosaccharide flippase family protein [Nodularia sphaerocarpa]MDB9374861.1 oligosaccharide flippase family protein [Nodularia sphaerocarpa CS-585]MDB9378881.1 oligosaccharide flippase family protein [Nodularia sphaerocarpa CS-585A2]ULP70476.1 Stage V sporulation protein B [Nodularia sphaerocarpa UHCC 0038]